MLITGESGVGKELVARAIHARSPRVREPFVPVNCAGIPETLLESELFGHVKGSFTGAYRDKPGKLEYADNGTMFLDEIGEMTLRMQGLLLRFLETGELQKVGADRASGRVNVRVIAATNRNLRDMIAEGQFREDLFYRLNVIHLIVPPLRERREDIPVLVESLPRSGSPNGSARRARASRRRPWRRCASTPGRATSASSRTSIERLVVTAERPMAGIDDLPLEVRMQRGVSHPPETRAPPHGGRRSVSAAARRARVVLDRRLPALHAAGDHRTTCATWCARARGGARQLQDRRAAVQHGAARLQAVPELPAQARLPAAVQGVPTVTACRPSCFVLRRMCSLRAAVTSCLAPQPLAPARDAAPVAARPRRPASAPVAGACRRVAPPDYVIGPDDVLTIMFWREKEMSR